MTTITNNPVPGPNAHEERAEEPTPKPTPPRVYKQNVAGLSKTATERNQRIVQDIIPKVVGPMPTNKFIWQAVSQAPRHPPDIPRVYFLLLCLG